MMEYLAEGRFWGLAIVAPALQEHHHLDTWHAVARYFQRPLSSGRRCILNEASRTDYDVRFVVFHLYYKESALATAPLLVTDLNTQHSKSNRQRSKSAHAFRSTKG